MTNGHNGHDRAQLEGYLNRVDSLDDELMTLKGRYMADCKGPRGRIKDILAEVRESDINIKAFKELLQTHRDDRKRLARIEALEADDRDAYEILEEALGDFGETPLGAATLKRARPQQQDGEPLDTI